MSFLVFFRFARAQRLGPRDPMGPKGGALRGPKGPLGLGGYSEAISNGWPLRMEGNYDWNAMSNGRPFHYNRRQTLIVTACTSFKQTFPRILETIDPGGGVAGAVAVGSGGSLP